MSSAVNNKSIDTFLSPVNPLARVEKKTSKRHNRSAVYRLPLVSKLERMRWSRWIPAYDRLPSPIHAQLERAKSRLFERMPKTSVDFVLQPQDRRRLASAYEQDVISLRAAVELSFEDWADFAVAL